jgi:hypothetical protein
MLMVNWFTIGCGIPFAAQSIYALRDYVSGKRAETPLLSAPAAPALAQRPSGNTISQADQSHGTAETLVYHAAEEGPTISRGSRLFFAGCFCGGLGVGGAILGTIWLMSGPVLSAPEQGTYDLCLAQGKPQTACDALIRILRNQYGR